jgi:hypothetical protein
MSDPSPPILTEETTLAWLSQFQVEDQARAAKLAGSLTLVSHDEFVDNLRTLLAARGEARPGPVALYAERELPKRFGVPHRLFKEPNRKVKRAEGVGPQPVKPTRGYDPEVGSEGLVAQLITELCRTDPKKYVNHPGPDEIRRRRIRRFFVVTDLVGSGRRARTYLEAAWRVRSVRSWWSLRLLRFEVVAYAATERGRAFVAKHPCAPVVSYAIPCPTIDTVFSRPEAASMKGLCIHYDPIGREVDESLGVGGLGTLIAFAHGAPNNAPRILHKSGTGWTPLFLARVTSTIPSRHFGTNLTAETIRRRLVDLRHQALARGGWLKTASDQTRKAFLLMAAVGRPPRSDDMLAIRTGLTVIDVQTECQRLIELGWMHSGRRLTDAGYGQLAHAREDSGAEQDSRASPVARSTKPPYYPQSLRSPTAKSR